MIAKNWNDLNKQIQKKIDDSLKKEVAETVKQIELEHIKSDVYDVYNPVVYERRGANGGLGDYKNLESKVKDGILTVINITEASPSQYPYEGEPYSTFPEWIENGLVPNVWNDRDYEWMHPRPFTVNTIKELEQTGEHINSLAKGLKRNGLNVDW